MSSLVPGHSQFSVQHAEKCELWGRGGGGKGTCTNLSPFSKQCILVYKINYCGNST